MFTCKDVPLIIDDYAPQFSSAQESKTLAKTAHAVVRMVGNRSSRGRRNADMSARALLPPRGSVLMTAEQPLTGQSIVGRTVVVPVEYGAIDVDRLSAAQDVHDQYSVAMAGYVQWLIVNWERVQEESSHLIAAWLASLRGAFPNQDRLADYYAALRLGLHWALLFGESIGAIDESLDLENGYAIDLLTLLESQSVRVAEQSPVVKFFVALDDLLAGGQVAILPRTHKNAVGEEAPTEALHGTALIGWKLPSEKRVWLLTAPALIAVKEYWNGLDERFDTLIDALRREMWQHGYIPERDDRQIELTKRINRHEQRHRLVRRLWWAELRRWIRAVCLLSLKDRRGNQRTEATDMMVACMDDEHHDIADLARQHQQRAALLAHENESLRAELSKLRALMSRHADEIETVVPPIGGTLDNIMLGGPVDPGE